MCEIWKYPTRKEEEITADVVSKLPDNLGRVNLTGGEPMIREDVEELAKILYKKAKLVEISTNGFFTERIINIANKFPRVIIFLLWERVEQMNNERKF
jgi:molybdenum cofactor biosynthesis enzyme MoaA